MFYPASIATLNSKNQITYSSICPEHHKKVSNPRYIQKGLIEGAPTLWGYVCGATSGPRSDGHVFWANESSGAPQTPDEIEAYKEQLRTAKAMA
jgi:hypothetical protein